MKGAQVSHNVVVEVCENLPRCTSLLIRNFDLEEAVENRVCATFFFRFRELCLEKVTSNMARGLRFLLIWNFALGEKISPDIMLCG